MISFIDTHCHLDGDEFAADRDEVVQRARESGCTRIFLPAIDIKSCHAVLATASQYPGYCFPMLGLHPEEVRSDWRKQLADIKEIINSYRQSSDGNRQSSDANRQSSDSIHQTSTVNLLAIGEIGLDFYWSREFEQEQLEAFEEQVRWSVAMRLPLMIHCRKAQNELVAILKRYQDQLPGGVFHCFTGNALEAKELLQFERFVLGIGGVLTFKKSHLPEVLPEAVPLDRIVLETDAPYMAPVPMRGQRNEPAFVAHVLRRLAEAYGVAEEEVAAKTNANCQKILNINV